jgi:hypothetical protein
VSSVVGLARDAEHAETIARAIAGARVVRGPAS